MDVEAISAWLVHQRWLLVATAVLVVSFRALTSSFNRYFKNVYKTPLDVGNAVYRAVGLVHHSVQVPLATLVLLQPSFWTDRLAAHTLLSTAMMVISSAYFVHDFFHAIEYVQVQGPAYILHGAGCAAVFLYGLLSQPPALHFFGAGFLMWEVSSFFVHFRWFAFRHQMNSSLQLLNGLLLVLSFFFARIVWGFYLSYLFYQDSLSMSVHPALMWLLYGSNMALNGLNVWWFTLILLKVVETVKGPSSKKSA